MKWAALVKYHKLAFGNKKQPNTKTLIQKSIQDALKMFIRLFYKIVLDICLQMRVYIVDER